MNARFRFFVEDDFLKLEELILASYDWCTPIWSLSRHEFCYGVHVAWASVKDNWRRTCGIWEEDGKIVSAVISEGVWRGDAFFLFDSPERQHDRELLESMFHHAETHLSCMPDNRAEWIRKLTLQFPPELASLGEMARERGFIRSRHEERSLVLPFAEKKFDAALPEGYRIADGLETPDFYPANTHMLSFNYTLPTAETIEYGFRRLRTMPGYRPELDLCVLDPEGKPVGMSIIWLHDKMPYCELEPMGVVWWERRRGIARALIHEAANRVLAIRPDCSGMLGGDQQFYWDLGFEVAAVHETWEWSREF